MKVNVYVSTLPKKDMLSIVTGKKVYDRPEVAKLIAEFVAKLKALN